MRWGKPRPHRCDALDVAAIWPCSGQSGFFAIPEIESSDTKQRHPVDEEDR
jgi:hypothetical protein